MITRNNMKALKKYKPYIYLQVEISKQKLLAVNAAGCVGNEGTEEVQRNPRDYKGSRTAATSTVIQSVLICHLCQINRLIF